MVTNSREYDRHYRLTHPEYVRRKKALSIQYQKANPDRVKEWRKHTITHLKTLVLCHYSKGTPKCAVCGEVNLKKLNLDHINEDGREHRKTITGLNQLYLWVRRNNFPETFQVLCHRCNILKYYASKRKFGGD
jgi:hypothetical protein